MTQSPSTSLPLQTLSDAGKPPSKRVSSAADAQTIVASLVYSNRERARFNAKIKGMLDGNPPYDAAKLKANAQSYRANINFMEGESSLSAAMVPYYDLFAGSQYYAEVQLYLDNPDDMEVKSRIATEEFDCLLKKYQGFIFQMDGVLHDFVAFGKGFAMFPKKWGWHFQRVSFNRVFVSDGTEASVEKLEIATVREKMQLHTLWGYIKDAKTAAAAGWHPTAVADAIRKAMPEDREHQANTTLSYEYVQQRMRDRDLCEGTRQPTVAAAHLLTREFDGTITHQIVEETLGVANGQTGGDAPKPLFLFEKRGLFTNMREVLSAFFFETLDGSWNGARGLGHKIYSAMEIKNRLLCKIVDNAFLSGGITLQANDASSLQKTNLVQAGDFNIIPPGYAVQNAQIFVNSSGLGATNLLLDQTISSNTGIFKAKMEKPQGNPRTAKEVEIQYQNATVLSASGCARFYRQLDPFYAELYRRVTTEEPISSDKSEEAEAVRDFRARCAKRGVTLKDLRSVESVTACRNIGNGSQMQRTQTLERFEQFVPMLPESGKQAWMEDLVASEFTAGKVARYVPPRDKQLLPNDQQAMALLENAAMKSGAPVAWTPTQNNVIHATEHLKAMSAGAQSLQQGAQPMEVLAFLEDAGPHTQIHLAHLQSDPSRKKEFELLQQQFKQMAQFTDQLQAQVQKQQQEQADQAQQNSPAVRSGKIAESMSYKDVPDDIKRQMEAAAGFKPSGQPNGDPQAAKVVHGMQLKDMQARHKMELDAVKAKQDLAIKDLQAAQQIRHAAVKANAEMVTA